MQMTDVDYNGLLVRVTKLESQNRFWKITGQLMLLAAVFSLTANVTAQQVNPNAPKPTVELLNKAAPSTTLEAQAFVLKDSAGVMRGKMTVEGDRYPVLEFYDLDGNVEWSTYNRAIPAK
jgi:hypothetical protein